MSNSKVGYAYNYKSARTLQLEKLKAAQAKAAQIKAAQVKSKPVQAKPVQAKPVQAKPAQTKPAQRKRILNDDFPVGLIDRLKKVASKTVKKTKSVKGSTGPHVKARQYKGQKRDGKVKLITQRDLDDTLFGLLINEPGYYRLAESLTWAPQEEFTAAITIFASSVVLDLGIHTLAQVNAVPNTYGIIVARDQSRVKITADTLANGERVGRILDFTLGGVRVLGRTDHITLENFIVTQSEPRGLTNDQIPELAVDIITLTMQVGIIIGEGDTEYIAFVGTDRSNKVTDLVIRNVVSEKAVIGCHIVFTDTALLEDNLWTQNSYYGLLAGPSWLVTEDDDPTKVVFPVNRNFTVRRNRGDFNNGPFEELSNPEDSFVFDFLSGISYYQAQDFYTEESSASNNTSPTYLLAVDHDGSKGMRWRNSVTNNNRSEFFVCDGFHMSGSVPFTIGQVLGVDIPLSQNIDADIEGVTSTGNSGVIAHNFNFSYVNGISARACVAEGATSNGGEAIGIDCIGTAGIPGGTNSNLVFKNCIVQRNGTENSSRSAGIRVAAPSNNVIIEECVVNGNATGVLEGSVAAGILVNPRQNSRTTGGELGAANIVIENNTVNANGTQGAAFSGGIVVIRRDDVPREDLRIENVLVKDNTSTYNIGDGILVGGAVLGVTVKGNQVYQNTEVGIEVDSENQVLTAKNFAYDNAGGNYAGVPSDDIIEASQGNLPLQVGAKNVSVV